ncbi:TetR/AcrR family transcriptional regulator [Alkalihalobacillus deserti]|uniref:TetR/AcrR family transcriptional regulator n=1 Tax=Alkalihalobacillus deserti TaxID=2879466 RepID=UPI001D13CB1E|nr:TetR/AcrR family transcriptional regulator [Alkalihalobacillus deserti]
MTGKSVRDRIIETALFLFEKNGYHAVGVNKIIEESGTSKGGFYHNFKSKDELLYIIHDTFITYAVDKAQEAYLNWDTPIERLYHIVKSFARVFYLYKPHTTVFYQESVYLSSEYYKAIKIKRDKYRDIIFKVIQEGINSGQFLPNLPVPIIGMSIFGMVNWTYKWYRPDGSYAIEEIADVYADYVLRGIMTDEAKKNYKFFSRFFSSE